MVRSIVNCAEVVKCFRILEQKGISDDLGEWMGNDEIVNNGFRDAHSRIYIKRMSINGKEPVIQSHERVSEVVRCVIIEELGDPPTEELPTHTKSLMQVRKDEARCRTRGMDLFPDQDYTSEILLPADYSTE